MPNRYYVNPYEDVTQPKTPVAIEPAAAQQHAVDALRTCMEHVSVSQRTYEGGLYTGYPGVGWAALYLVRPTVFATAQASILEKSKAYVEAATAHTDRLRSTNQLHKEGRLSFLVGAAGIWVLAAKYYHVRNQLELRDRYLHEYTQLASEYLDPVIFRCGSDEMFVGRAGYLVGLCTLRSVTGQMVLRNEEVFAICDAIVASGREYSAQHFSPAPLMYAYYQTEYLGAGHGLVGILFALMLFPEYIQSRPKASQLIQETLVYMISVTPEQHGNLPAAVDETYNQATRPESELLVHWCHGAAGAVYAYARAYILWKDQRYLNECRRCADTVWKRGLLKKGPGICHGVAGSGYVFLILYRLTGEKLYLHRATAFGHFMLSDAFKQARRPDCPYSLYEGLAGTACFWMDLALPSTAAFPFMDPFWDQPPSGSA